MREDEKKLFIAFLQYREYIQYKCRCEYDVYDMYRIKNLTDIDKPIDIISKWAQDGFWVKGCGPFSIGCFVLEKLPKEYKEIYDEIYTKYKFNNGLVLEPKLEKSDPHGFDYTPLSWSDFLKLREAARISADNIGYPVYLVGSVLRRCAPRDIDISVIIPVREYQEMFGILPTKQEDFGQYLANVINKTFDQLSELHTCLIKTHHLDIKVCPDTWWKEKDKMLLASPKNNN